MTGYQVSQVEIHRPGYSPGLITRDTGQPWSRDGQHRRLDAGLVHQRETVVRFPRGEGHTGYRLVHTRLRQRRDVGGRNHVVVYVDDWSRVASHHFSTF